MAKCKGCGKEIVWGRTDDGKNIPLDRRAPVYLLVEGKGDVVKVIRGGGMVSHFSTCPHASQFSATNRKEQPK